MSEKYSVGLWAFGPLIDRFNTTGYKPRFNLEQQIGLVAQAKGVRGVKKAMITSSTTMKKLEI